MPVESAAETVAPVPAEVELGPEVAEVAEAALVDALQAARNRATTRGATRSVQGRLAEWVVEPQADADDIVTSPQNAS